MTNFFKILIILFTFQSINSQTLEELERMYNNIRYLEQKEEEAETYIFGTRNYISNLIIDNYEILGSENYVDLLRKEKILWYKVDMVLKYYHGSYIRFLNENPNLILEYKNQMLSLIKSKLPAKISCKNVVKYVKNNYQLLETKDSYELKSSWLKKVSLYFDKENQINVVIAEMYIDNKYNEYIFCSITFTDWNDFAVGGFNLPKSFGERFWKTIMNKKCNCD